MRTQLIGVVRNWGLGLKEEMGGFEKRVGMRWERDGREVEG